MIYARSVCGVRYLTLPWRRWTSWERRRGRLVRQRQPRSARQLRPPTGSPWLMADAHRGRQHPVPDPCQIVRGSTGNGGDQAAAQSGPAPASPLFSQAAAYREPKLPKLRARVRFSSPAPCQTLRSMTRGLFVVWTGRGSLHHWRTINPLAAPPCGARDASHAPPGPACQGPTPPLVGAPRRSAGRSARLSLRTGPRAPSCP